MVEEHSRSIYLFLRSSVCIRFRNLRTPAIADANVSKLNAVGRAFASTTLVIKKKTLGYEGPERRPLCVYLRSECAPCFHGEYESRLRPAPGLLRRAASLYRSWANRRRWPVWTSI